MLRQRRAAGPPGSVGGVRRRGPQPAGAAAPADPPGRPRPRRAAGVRGLRGLFLVHDGGASHIARATAEYLGGCAGWWRPRLTPAHASWLNQAELLGRAFGRRYLKRGSWASREEFIEQVMAAWHEYNRWYAHPFNWTWSNDRMRKWYAEHGQ